MKGVPLAPFFLQLLLIAGELFQKPPELSRQINPTAEEAGLHGVSGQLLHSQSLDGHRNDRISLPHPFAWGCLVFLWLEELGQKLTILFFLRFSEVLT